MRSTAVTGNPHSFRALQSMVLAAALVALLAPTGCVRRRLAVRSNPPGAVVFVDNQQIGTTPCAVDFTYYGTREIRLVKPGYETLTVNQPIPTPWYQFPPIDFVSENLLPNKIEDHRTVAFNLEPQIIVPTEQLIERGNQLRQETLAGVAAPPAVVVPGPTLAPGNIAPGTFVPGAMTAPGTIISPGAAPPETFAPAPTLAPTLSPTPSTQPIALPPIDQPPYTQSPYGQPLPPATYGSSTVPPNTIPPATLPPTTTSPGTYSPTPAPFTAPALPPIPPAGTQQGPPIVSPPLR